MDALLKKLNLTNQQHALLVNVPTELTDLTAAFSEHTAVSQHLETLNKADFVMGFVQQLVQVDQLAAWIATHTEGDATVWMVYPKQSSKNYRCEFNRDSGWASLGKAGFEPVRMVAVNNDWSALRFRRAVFIKTMIRDPKHMLSEEAKKRGNQVV